MQEFLTQFTRGRREKFIDSTKFVCSMLIDLIFIAILLILTISLKNNSGLDVGGGEKGERSFSYVPSLD